jgi:hypothetical protein
VLGAVSVERDDWGDREDRVRMLARQHLIAQANPSEVPTNLHAVARGLGVRIRSEPCEEDPEYTGSMFIGERRLNGFLLLVVNDLLTPQRWAFTVAHELGHVALKHRGNRTATQERLANVYASELLVPTDRLYRQVRTYGQNIRYLAGINGVSYQVMQTRFGELPATTVRWVERQGWQSLMGAIGE